MASPTINKTGGWEITERRIALYARVSTEEQDVKPQLDRLRDWAAKSGFVVAGEYWDVASGRDANRPGQQRVLQAAKGHHVHGVAVCKVDRWARSIQHFASTVDGLQSLGIEFHCIDQGLSLRKDDPSSRLVLTVLGAIAEWESGIISERTKEALAAKRKAGVRLGRPPLLRKDPFRKGGSFLASPGGGV